MSDVNTGSKRPLSPHISIYKPIPTMVVSIVHRLTGAVLYLGTLLLVWWLIGAATSEAYFNYVNSFIGSFLGRLILFGFTWALIQHTLGGIKHLFWDVGYGFEKDFSTKIAWLTVIASILLTFAVWYVGYAVR
jgi:succinate dehydrogenase / fumarate reductase cytochrome b subunit